MSRFDRRIEKKGTDAAKRLCDITVVLLALPFLVPFFIVASAVVAISVRGNPIYARERIGRDGKKFHLLKFKTTFAPNNAAPRMTLFGEVLQRTSMNELPSLINVLRGDMTLVGPRPLNPRQKSTYPGAHYEKMRPGITGSWLLSAATKPCEEERAKVEERSKHDLDYFKRRGLWTDIKIFAKTIVVVLRGR
ncbi:MAG: sugar transferase [Pseudomonadota bacterium]